MTRHPSFARTLQPVLLQRAAAYPVVTLTGPRQAGKTTLVRQAFPAHAYFNLERPDLREFARTDPRAFLAGVPAAGAVFDEVQRVPELLSWVQVTVDEDPRPGRFVLTGSHSFDLMSSITQSLAGRTALLELLPLSLAELRAAGIRTGTDRLLFAGGYPRIHADDLDPAVALADYFATYVERDLRQLVELRQLDAFRRFVALAAGRIGQLLNLDSLASDCGVSGPTAKAWVALLEASYVVRLLRPWHANLGKRLIKSPKLYFCDVGLACWLVGIREEGQLAAHPLRGSLFENLVVMEFVKHALHHGQGVGLHFFRDARGLEADLVVEQGMPPGQIGLVEIKSGRTVHAQQFEGLARVADLLGPRVQRRMLIHDGDEVQQRTEAEVVGLLA